MKKEAKKVSFEDEEWGEDSRDTKKQKEAKVAWIIIWSGSDDGEIKAESQN